MQALLHFFSNTMIKPLKGTSKDKANNNLHTAQNGMNISSNTLDEQKFQENLKAYKYEDDSNKGSNIIGYHNQGIEYSTDIKPPVFKMDKISELKEQKVSSQEYLDLQDQIRQRIQIASHSSYGTTNVRLNNSPWKFGFMGREQIEEYLGEPQHIRCVPRKTDFGLFNRLFLAQELKYVSDGQTYPGEKSGSHTRVSRSRGRGSISSHVSFSDSLNKAIWTIRFSLDGKYMATGSKDGTVKIFKVICSPVERWELDNIDESKKASRAEKMLRMKQMAASATYDKLNNDNMEDSITSLENISSNENESTDVYAHVFHPSPKTFREHKYDVLDIDWSKNNFLLTASMDKTVKLWHLDRKEALRTFIHADFVTGVRFHPTDDRFFVTGCLDHKCRLWSIIDNEMSYEYDCNDLITSIEISKDGEFTYVGTFNGFLHIILTRGLKSVMSFHVSDKEVKKTETDKILTEKHLNGPRITGIQITSEPGNPVTLLITSNDSKIRLFDMKERKLVEFFKGFQSGSSQHRAQFTVHNDEPVVTCSSDDHWIYGWKLKAENNKDVGAARPGANTRAESFLESNLDSSTSSIGSDYLNDDNQDDIGNSNISIDDKNNKSKKGRRRSRIFNSIRSFTHSHHHHHQSAIKNSNYTAFHAHHAPVTVSIVAPVETSKVLSLSNDFICELTLETVKDAKSTGDREIKSFNEGNKDALKAIGTILISADDEGTIRVFRSDISTKIRNKALQKLQNYNYSSFKENEGQNHIHLQNSYFPPMDRGKSTTTVHNEVTGNTLGTLLSDQNTLKNSNSSIRDDEKHFLKTPNENIHSYKQNISNHNIYTSDMHDRSGSSINRVKNNDGKSYAINSGPGTPSSDKDRNSSKKNGAELSSLSLRCNICGSTNFNQLSNNSHTQRDNIYSCADCGTMLNNFR